MADGRSQTDPSTGGAFRPAEAVRSIEPYDPPRPPTRVDHDLAGNVGPLSSTSFTESLEAPSPRSIRDYPDREAVRRAIGRHFGLPPERILVTAGSDGAIIRTCRVALEPGRTMVVPEPTFSLFPRFARLAGAELRTVEWLDGPFPAEGVRAVVDERTGLVVAVTPNNPTGLVAERRALEAVIEEAASALTLIDHAYVEYADQDLTSMAIERDDVVVTRTLSKAWGMAGLRLGFAVAAPDVIEALAAAGNPYPVSAASIRIASRRLETGEREIERHVETVVDERERLGDLLEEYGIETTDSRANFVYGRFDHAEWVHAAFAGMGFGVRAFSEAEGPTDALRVTAPGDAKLFDELERAVRTIFEPEALFLDLDGVLADVSDSYRRAIVQTAAEFGVELTDEDVSHAKSAGDANNDWILTHRLLEEAGVEVEYERVKEVYEDRYQGRGEFRGLWRQEELMHSLERIEEISGHLPIGIVTGRPRRDADRFFEETGLDRVIETAVCMEDAPRKPAPDPVELLGEKLGVERAWMLGDTPDDVRAARASESVSVLPLGAIAPGEEEERMRSALLEAGCARVLEGFEQLESLLEATGRRGIEHREVEG